MQKKVNALIDIKLEKFKNLPEETNFFWWEISGGTVRFDRIENEVWAFFYSYQASFYFRELNWQVKEIIVCLSFSLSGRGRIVGLGGGCLAPLGETKVI